MTKQHLLISLQPLLFKTKPLDQLELHDGEDGAKQRPAKHMSGLKFLETITEDGNMTETEPPKTIQILNISK